MREKQECPSSIDRHPAVRLPPPPQPRDPPHALAADADRFVVDDIAPYAAETPFTNQAMAEPFLCRTW